MTIKKALTDFLLWKETHMDNSNAYRVALRPLVDFCGDWETKDVTIETITSIVSKMKGSTTMFLTVLKVFALYCHYSKIDMVNPQLIRVKRKQDPVEQPSLTEEDIDMLCEVQDDNTFLGIRNQLIIRMLFETGVRLSELLSLTISHFTERDPNDQEVDANCVKVMTRKSKIYRYVMWTMETHKLLLTYMAMRLSMDVDTDRLFIGNRGTVLTSRGVQYMFNKVSSEVMGEVHHPHECRHGKVHHLIRNKYGKGVPTIVEVARILGHKNVESVMTYFRLHAKESLTLVKKYI